MERLLTEKELAVHLGVALRKLMTWRQRTRHNKRNVEKGPKFIYLVKSGNSQKHLRYRESDVDKWIKNLRSV